jgi:hypothetical protein
VEREEIKRTELPPVGNCLVLNRATWAIKTCLWVLRGFSTFWWKGKGKVGLKASFPPAFAADDSGDNKDLIPYDMYHQIMLLRSVLLNYDHTDVTSKRRYSLYNDISSRSYLCWRTNMLCSHLYGSELRHLEQCKKDQHR